MILLGIDSTGDTLRVGLSKDGQLRIKTSSARPHSRRLLFLIDRLLEKKRPDAIAVAIGPGSYTGTRVGVVTANVLGWAWKIPVFGVTKTQATTIVKLVEVGEKRYEKKNQSRFATPLYESRNQ